jgi:DNA-binding NarL/FixJ family response regulator
MDSTENERGAEPTKIIIADDHPLVRESLRQMLRGHSDLEVVAEASDGSEVVELCRRLHPELVLMDIRMPKMDGIEATRQIKRESPSTIVLVLTAFENPDYMAEALKAGVSGYILKEADSQQIIGAIRRTLEGELPLSQEVAARLLMRLINERQQEKTPEELSSSSRKLAAQRPAEPPPLREPLTIREKEVLRLLVQGQTNQQIAKSLFISTSTVKHHVGHLMAKLGASDRVQAAIMAIELGLVTDHLD